MKGKPGDEALTYCQNRNSYLVEVTTSAEVEFLGERLQDRSFTWFWTGATDRNVTGTFVYQHSNQQVPDQFWREGQPDDDWGNEHCVIMSRFVGDLKLYESQCDWDWFFVCEK